MDGRKLVSASVAVAAALLMAGCATTSALREVAAVAAQQQERIKAMEATARMLDERSKTHEARIEQAIKLPASLESDVAAVRGYAREVEKRVTDLRELIAKQLDLQNAHITQVKTSYGNVLQQQGQMVETMSKTLETALAELKAAIVKSIEELKRALPGSDSTVPPSPTLKDQAPPPPPAPPAPPAPPGPPAPPPAQ